MRESRAKVQVSLGLLTSSIALGIVVAHLQLNTQGDLSSHYFGRPRESLIHQGRR